MKNNFFLACALLQLMNASGIICMERFDHMSVETIRHVLSYYDNDGIHATTTLRKVTLLNRVCKKFQQAIDGKTIGRIFEHYDKDQKDRLLTCTILNGEKTSLSAINPAFYPLKRKIVLGLVCSGAQLKNESANMLIHSAMQYDDKELIAFLCHGKKIDISREHWDGIPHFFWARTIQMAQLCQSNGIKLDQIPSPRLRDLYPNILWATMHHAIPSAMVEFYLQQNISTQPRALDGKSLLHQLAACCCANIDINNMLKKGELLLAQQPLSINALDNNQKTPLDCTKDALKQRFALIDDTTPAERLITFLKDKGGMTSKELLPQNNIKTRQQTDECIIS